MYRKLLCTLCLLLFSAAMVVAEDSGSTGPNGSPNGPDEANVSADPAAKAVRGMSVLGNNEAPMSLVIVPWKSSELGSGTSLSRTLNERDLPVDRDVFLRELAFYQASVAGKTTAPAAVSLILK